MGSPFATGKPLTYTRLLSQQCSGLGGIPLRNQDAARYARYAAWAAAAVALVVAGVYAHRAIRAARARQNAPPSIPDSVQQQSAEFSYVGTDQGRALFRIRASHATQYKDQNRALLQDVWITIYGHNSDRNDNIHTRECNYEPSTGNVVCEGDVQIDLASAAPRFWQAGRQNTASHHAQFVFQSREWRGLHHRASAIPLSAGRGSLRRNDLQLATGNCPAHTQCAVGFGGLGQEWRAARHRHRRQHGNPPQRSHG